MATLKFKVEWFGKQAELLEDAADAVHDLYCDIEGIQYHPWFEMAPIENSYEALRRALLVGDNSLCAGEGRYREFAQGIRETERAYAEREAANTAQAQQIRQWLEDAGL